MTAPISESGRGTVSHAVDLVAGRDVSPSGRGVTECSILPGATRAIGCETKLTYSAIWHQSHVRRSVLDLLEDEDEGDLILVLEYFDGEMLEQRVRQFTDSGRTLPCTQLIAWARQLARCSKTSTRTASSMAISNRRMSW